MLKFVSKVLATFVMGMNSLMCVSPITLDKFYCDTFYYNETGSNYTDITTTIEFSRYDLTDDYLPRLLPFYENYTQTNSCAPMAGAITIGYYDVDYPELVPNFETAFYLDGEFVEYYGTCTEMVQLKEHLYDLMGTNSIQAGTSISQFKTGMTTYVNEQNRNIAYINCGDTFNLTSMLTQINLLRPAVLFIDGFEYYPSCGIQESSTSIYMAGRLSTAGHVAVCFGYYKYQFYNSSNVNFQTDEYLLVAFGDGDYGLLRMNANTTIDATIAINIY